MAEPEKRQVVKARQLITPGPRAPALRMWCSMQERIDCYCKAISCDLVTGDDGLIYV